MQYITNPPKANLQGFSENFLRDAYENIFNDTSYFYSLLQNQFAEKSEIALDRRLKILVRDSHLRTQTADNYKTIIIADDDEDDRQFFKEALRELTIKTNVIEAKDGTELMDHLNNSRNLVPHLVFLDINMPKKNGIECLMEVRNNDRLKTIPVAIYSTSASEEDIRETFLNGANIYIKKPNDFRLIKKILREVISANWDLQRRNMETYFINT